MAEGMQSSWGVISRVLAVLTVVLLGACDPFPELERIAVSQANDEVTIWLYPCDDEVIEEVRLFVPGDDPRSRDDDEVLWHIRRTTSGAELGEPPVRLVVGSDVDGFQVVRELQDLPARRTFHAEFIRADGDRIDVGVLGTEQLRDGQLKSNISSDLTSPSAWQRNAAKAC